MSDWKQAAMDAYAASEAAYLRRQEEARSNSIQTATDLIWHQCKKIGIPTNGEFSLIENPNTPYEPSVAYTLDGVTFGVGRHLYMIRPCPVCKRNTTQVVESLASLGFLLGNADPFFHECTPEEAPNE